MTLDTQLKETIIELGKACDGNVNRVYDTLQAKGTENLPASGTIRRILQDTGIYQKDSRYTQAKARIKEMLKAYDKKGKNLGNATGVYDIFSNQLRKEGIPIMSSCSFRNYCVELGYKAGAHGGARNMRPAGKPARVKKRIDPRYIYFGPPEAV